MSRDGAIIGVSDSGGWVVLGTVAGSGPFKLRRCTASEPCAEIPSAGRDLLSGAVQLLDRRRVELVDDDLPKTPRHSEGQALPLDDAVALVEFLA